MYISTFYISILLCTLNQNGWELLLDRIVWKAIIHMCIHTCYKCTYVCTTSTINCSHKYLCMSIFLYTLCIQLVRHLHIVQPVTITHRHTHIFSRPLTVEMVLPESCKHEVQQRMAKFCMNSRENSKKERETQKMYQFQNVQNEICNSKSFAA